jgi:hypothetical protein
MRALVASVVGVVCLAGALPAGAKDFKPGDLRICNATRCIRIVDRLVLPTIGTFYYGDRSPRSAPAPRMGAPAFELRFTNGYATGVVAGAKLDRFLSFGVNVGHFRRGVWYRVPPRLADELRHLAAGLRPLRVTKATLAKSR